MTYLPLIVTKSVWHCVDKFVPLQLLETDLFQIIILHFLNFIKLLGQHSEGIDEEGIAGEEAETQPHKLKEVVLFLSTT